MTRWEKAMAWVYLVAAGLFEIGWPVGLKWAQEPGKVIIGVAMAVVCMGIQRPPAFPGSEGDCDWNRVRGLDRHRSGRNVSARRMGVRRPG